MNNFSVKAKILSLVILFAIVVAALSANSAMTSKAVSSELEALSANSLTLVKNLERSRQLLLKQTVEFERGFFQVSIAKSMGGYGVEQIQESADKFKQYSQELADSLVEVKTTLQLLPDNAYMAPLIEQIDQLEALQVEFLNASTETYDWWLKLKTMQANKARRNADELLVNINGTMESIMSTIDEYSADVSAAQTTKLDNTLATSAVITLVVIIAGLTYSILVIRSIVAPLKKAVKRAEAIASGKLTRSSHKTVRRDEIGALEAAFDTLIDQLATIIDDVMKSSTALSSAATDLNRITTDSSAMVDRQQQETAQISQAIQEIQTTAVHVSQATTEASEAAHSAEAAANEGTKIVHSTIATIEGLADELSRSANTIQNLKQNTDEINNILNVILGIAEQTNLLALNAAIEAARAGEQGRGFAVVADEVRHLAQNTQDATQQIEQMIQALQSGTTEAVRAMTQSHERSVRAVEQVRNEGESLAHINGSVTQIRDMNDRISTTAEEQASVTTEVRRNIDNISTITNETTSAMHALNARADQLSELATELTQKVRYFELSQQ
ncbi:methyl-accepting chemotaxis protein [Maribrevibacterium harenarium]|uniref:Methyl-accepting chemotaxis protein n=1 Tax=Maribrevibacterium harenarium TaxID=2589817 RepID=A0A501WAB5_9GAMM|nr:methyl-accepting chemotaxis protein [Maribrevibacterium harenarium]TPE46569.1 methyl-accepting chemotaxis protein [Maribrevibacterium harenarium]